MEKFKNREVSEITKENLSKAATGRIFTEEEKQKISLSRQGKVMSLDTRSKISAHMTKLIGKSIIVKNTITNEENEYQTLTEGAKALGVSRTAVKKVLDTSKLLLKIYSVTTKLK